MVNGLYSPLSGTPSSSRSPSRPLNHLYVHAGTHWYVDGSGIEPFDLWTTLLTTGTLSKQYSKAIRYMTVYVYACLKKTVCY